MTAGIFIGNGELPAYFGVVCLMEDWIVASYAKICQILGESFQQITEPRLVNGCAWLAPEVEKPTQVRAS